MASSIPLAWPGRRPPEPVPPHHLVPEPAHHHGDPDTDNRVIHGDNAPALQALARTHRGRVHCIYIDPPYNTGSDHTHYTDAIAHGAWLSFMHDRLVLLRELLHEDGLLFVQIDDRELAYLQVLLDEVMGRGNRVNLITVKMSEVSGVKMSHVGRRLPKLKEFVLVYGKRPDVPIRALRVDKSPDKLAKYLKYYSKIIDNPSDPVEQWRIVPIRDHMKTRGLSTTKASIRAYQLAERTRVVYRTNNRLLAGLSFDTPTRRVVSPKGIDYVWWEGKQMLFLADHCEEYLGDLWTDISTINLNKEGGVRFRYSKKPEALLARVIAMSTDPGDLVLDAFAGSGTTAAVAHKLGRRWMTIEQGDHCHTHLLPRLRSVVDGTDRGGITERAGWTGGGGFRVYTLSPGAPAAERA